MDQDIRKRVEEPWIPRQNGGDLTTSRDTPTTTASAGPTATTGSSTRYIEFNWEAVDFDGVGDRVFNIRKNQKAVGLTWTVNEDNLDLQNISIVSVSDRNNQYDQYTVLSTVDLGSSNAGMGNFFQDVTNSTASVDFASWYNNGEIWDQIYSIQIYWTKSTSGKRADESDDRGRTWSAYFSAVNETGSQNQLDNLWQEKLKNMNDTFVWGYQASGSDSDDLVIGTQTTASTEATSAAPTSGSDTTNNGDAGDDNETSDKDDGGNGSGSSLSKGAIAGIAVGAVVVVALIGLLAFFLLRRRRRNKSSTAGYSQGAGAGASNGYMIDKNADDVVVTQDPHSPHSPHSRYSDEAAAGHQSTPLDPGAAHHHQHDATVASPVAAYHDGNTGSREITDDAHSNSARGETRAYHHLVEDGMTADDIRRLEEEERQLDDEIERSRRR